MNNLCNLKRAFISVSDKTNLANLCKFLHAINCEIVGTSSTYKAILDYGFPCIPADSLTQFPEMLGGRVKTLHPNIFGAILARPNLATDAADLQKFNIQTFDLVICNLYPFQQVLQQADINVEQLVEYIDIGGVSLLRASAKNYHTVNILVDPTDYAQFIKILIENNNQSPLSLREELAIKALHETAAYDAIIAASLEEKLPKNQLLTNSFGPVRKKNSEDIKAFPNAISLNLTKVKDLRYGENPHQKAAFYNFSEFNSANLFALNSIKFLHGKELSYNNMLDLEHAIALAHEFNNYGKYCAIIVKHNMPCGVGLSGIALLDAYNNAFAGDTVSPFGGVVCLNSLVTVDLALKLGEIFLELIAAPAFEAEAQLILQQKKNLRLITYNAQAPLANKIQFTQVQGGFLAQNYDDIVIDETISSCPTQAKPSVEIKQTMHFAMTIAKHLRSNAIVIANSMQTIALAGGFTNRVDAVQHAIAKANLCLLGAVLASDGFFPFADSIELIQAAGIKHIVQPGGSIKDTEVIQACDKYGLSMIFSGTRHFKH